MDKTLRWKAEEFSAQEWDAINDSVSGHPGLHSTNVQLLLKHFGTGLERVMVCRRGRNAVAMTILTGRLISTVWHPSQQTTALWVQLDDVDFEDLVSSLARRCLMLSVTHIDPDMQRRPSGQETVDYIETARTRVEGEFDDYWKARKSSLQDNVRSYRNRLKTAGIEPRMNVVTDAGEIGAAVDAFGILESAGWKGEAGSALHPDNPQGAYYRDLFTAYAAHGWASAWQCWYGDKLVASNLLIHRDRTALSLKTTFDESQKRTAPSMLLRYETFQRIWPDTDVVEYYGKEPGWRDWESDRRTMYHLNAFPSIVVEIVRGMVRRIRQARASGAPVTGTASDPG